MLLLTSLATRADSNPAGDVTDTQKRQVIDDSGQSVSLSGTPMRIADGWYAHSVLLMTLGAGDRIVATVNHPRSQPWMFTIVPSLNQAISVDATAFNVESLLAKHVDLVFTSKSDREARAYEQVGLPVMRMGFADFPALQRSMLATARALGGAKPLARADAYNAYLDAELKRAASKVAGLTPEQRPRVLHINSINPLKVDGSETLIDEWITIAGGRNAALGLKDNMQVVSAEQLLTWQPDVLILAAGAGDLKQASEASLLRQLKAVRKGNVLRNPSGVFPWDRYGTEEALQIQWAAQQLRPELFSDIDMVRTTIGFYRKFFDYSLSDIEAKRILSGLH